MAYPVLRKGSTGKYVTKLQKKLGMKLKKYGTFGTHTQAEVKEYQRKHKLKADGIVGPKTWLALTKPKTGSKAKNAVKRVVARARRRPSPGYAMSTYRKKQIYGSTPRAVRRNLRRVHWKRKHKTFYVHKRHVEQVRRAIAKIDAYEKKHHRNYRIRSVGTFAWRLVRGRNILSNHSFGSAIDFNPRQNPMSYRLRTNMPRYFVQAFKSEGARWGGNYRRRKDPMHFEF